MFQCAVLTCWLFLLLPTFAAAFTTNTSFTGKEFIEYSIHNHPQDSRKDKLTLRFKTGQAYGVLLYSCGMQGDFVMLELKRGKLVYTGSFGSLDEEEKSGIHSIIHDIQYNDNRWHHVTLLRESGSISLTVDSRTKSKRPEGDFEQLNLDTSFFIGGMGPSQRLDTTCHDHRDIKNFTGCLDGVRFNMIDLLYGAHEKFTGFTTHGNLPFYCRVEKNEIMAFNSENSMLQIKRDILVRNEMSVYFEVRTFEPNGHIFYHETTDGSASLDLINGKVRLTISFLFMSNAVVLKPDVMINDGDWHAIKLLVRRNESQVVLNVDEISKFYEFQKHFKLSNELGWFSGLVTFGGNTLELPSLVSCFRTIEVSKKKISLHSREITSKRNISDTCRIKDLCFPNPCLHGSKCSQSRGQFECDCSRTEYHGNVCQTCIHKRTCAELKASGVTKSGFYKLCPNNERVFTTYCDMKTGSTIFRHNLKNNTLVSTGKAYETSKISFYTHDIHYKVSQKDIVDLIGVSLNCKQYIRFDCYQSMLLNNAREKSESYYDYIGARWLSRDDIIQQHWGGSTAKAKQCACAESGSCAMDRNGRSKGCNCDVFDDKWRFDAGFLRNKDLLPVSGVQFSKGIQMNEKSFFSVGFFECFGTIPKPTTVPPSTTELIHLKNGTLSPTIVINNSSSEKVNVPLYMNTTHRLNNGSQTIVIENVSSETVSAIFSKPWLVTIVVIGAMLCLLLFFMVFLLFRNNIYTVFIKCVYGNHATKPRIEIEDYNRYSTATEEESDWDVYRLSTTFPTSTPDPSYGPTDDEIVNMRVRTLEDVRGKRRFKRLTGWGSRTASAPTVVGSSSKQSLTDLKDDDDSLCLPNMEVKYPSSSQHSTSKTMDVLFDERAYSTTATDGECDSLVEDDSRSEFSHKSSNQSYVSSMKESECSPLSKPKRDNHSSQQQQNKGSQLERPKRLDVSNRIDYSYNPNAATFSTTTKMNGQTSFSKEASVKAYYPVLPINGFRQPNIRRAHPIEYGAHLTMVNNNGVRCPRILAVNRRPSTGNDVFQMKHPPTIQERDEYSDEDILTTATTYENICNSDGFYEQYDHSAENGGSPSSETRLLFDDASSREECVREADEHIKLLKKKVIEKATSADECT